MFFTSKLCVMHGQLNGSSGKYSNGKRKLAGEFMPRQIAKTLCGTFEKTQDAAQVCPSEFARCLLTTCFGH